ncbi:MAG: hypothetical protein ACPL1Y_07335, partial [Thermoplasmata archaeon]
YALPAYAGEHRELHSNPDTDDDGIPDLSDTDSDNDGIKDGDEVLYWLDTDGDGNINMRDKDSDNDGLLDSKEDINCNGKLDAWESSPVAEDTDNDGLRDSQEWQRYFTNPANADTDGDGLGDAQEVQNWTYWYRKDVNKGEIANLPAGMPKSQYLLYLWANTSGNIKLKVNESTYIVSDAVKGEWYWLEIRNIIAPTQLKVLDGAIKQFVFIPVNNITNLTCSKSLQIRFQGNHTVDLKMPDEQIPLRVWNATYTYGIGENKPSVYLIIGFVNTTPMFCTMNNSSGEVTRSLPDFSGLISKYMENVGNACVMVNVTYVGSMTNYWFWFNFTLTYRPLFTNPFCADVDNDNLSDSLELKYGTNPFCADTDHDGIQDINETGRFTDSVTDASPDWNNSSLHTPGIYFEDLNKNITFTTASAKFNFTVDGTGLSSTEFPKPVLITVSLSGYVEVVNYTIVVYQDNNIIVNESGEGGLGFAQTVMFEETTSKTQRYYCAVIVEYEPTYPEPYMSIVLSFGLSERLTDP